MCPHTTPYGDTCVLILLYICPHTTAMYMYSGADVQRLDDFGLAPAAHALLNGHTETAEVRSVSVCTFVLVKQVN